jgi:hypothetical protein
MILRLRSCAALAQRTGVSVRLLDRYEQLVELQSHMLAVFLLAVCDVVVVVQDWAPDTDLLKFLLACEQLMPVRLF